QAQSHLMETRQNLETAMQAKDQFLATMSHEIRTPLNSIVGFTHLLLESQPTEDQEQMLRTLQFSTTNLLALINDILDYEKIEANRIDLVELHINLTGMLEDLHRGFEFEAEDKGIKLLLEVSPEIPAVRGDPVRITQVLTNLIGNAIKFTDEGDVRIEARVVRETIDRVLLEIAISDTGIGINPHDVELIFERFTQLNRGGDHERGGSGLGLTITRRLLELYGSELKVDSSPGKGSRFYFQLDLQKSTQRPDPGKPDRQAPPIQNYQGARILLVEDNEINIMVARRYIQNWGLHCVVARNGEEALQVVATDKFDLILMDLRMPGIDGYETTRRIKENEAYRSIPVIALTANVLVDTRQRALECGMVDYVCKPFDPVDLQQKIAIALESVREE
ncbi:MAG: response regulator, partial [Leptospiraceae bacterium]|nr:response regulator [Leptospiraceae bacterium]